MVPGLKGSSQTLFWRVGKLLWVKKRKFFFLKVLVSELVFVCFVKSMFYSLYCSRVFLLLLAIVYFHFRICCSECSFCFLFTKVIQVAGM